MTFAAVSVYLDLLDSLGRRAWPDAHVVQDDRHLVLAPPAGLHLDPGDRLDAAYAAVAGHRPIPCGRYLLLRPREGQPFWIYQAVVHDFRRRPTCRPSDVRQALQAALTDAVRRGLENVTIEPLGLLGPYGLELDAVVGAFDEAVVTLALADVKRLRVTMLLSNLTEVGEVSRLLRARVVQDARRTFRTVSDESALVEAERRGTRLHYRFVPGALSGYVVRRARQVA